MDNTLKKKVLDIIEELPEDKIVEVIDFMEFLKLKDEAEDDEILNDKELMESIERGLKDIENGNIYDFEDVFKGV
ncbi:hypothetical protein PQ690_11960 [Thermoanaerobacterium thermosaccharolyticum]|uniref:hypothetical protein n=1 Tax=Thermoanaerobacterium thermosaccharolyticum TaxID=1517 RepID=UPI003DA95138